MHNKLIFQALFILTLYISSIYGSNCNIPKECQLKDVTKRQLPTNQKRLICRLNDESQLRFSNESENCQRMKNETREIIIRPNEELSSKLKKETIDLENLIEYTKSFRAINLTFEYFNGFEIDLFDDEIEEKQIPNEIYIEISCYYCTFDFYIGEKPLKNCQGFIEETNSTNPRSIFQMFTKVSNYKIILYLSETNENICPLVFKDVQVYILQIYGENTFYSRRALKFSSHRFDNLNSKIESLKLAFPNVDLDFNILHPSVFGSLYEISIETAVNKIHPDLFIELNRVTLISLNLEHMRKIFHRNGIEWIKNMNKHIDCNLSNINEVYNYALSNKIKFIQHELDNRHLSPRLRDVFPDEDFCLYKDFPINQLVVIIRNNDDNDTIELSRPRKYIGCTYLWITRSYEALRNIYDTDKAIRSILESDEYKSIQKCNFEVKLKRCNRSDFKYKYKITYVEIRDVLYTISIVLNISSYILAILGLVSNILIIITVSSNRNEADIKEYKQYDYLRLNSICNCLILIIHMTTWLNGCIYPFQLFCPIIRKTVFMQYFKIIFQDVLMTALRFINSFTYIGFAFNRISLIGKYQNKLVKFMCETSIKKFIAVSLFISIGLSVIKFFKYDINYGSPLDSYPISYDYSISNTSSKNLNVFFFILNFISDILNHFVLLLVNLAIDIGLIIKLKQQVMFNERFEKFKEYNKTKTSQQEKKKTENDNVLGNTISVLILNTTLNLILKLPLSLYSLICLWYSYYLIHNTWENFTLEIFFKRYFIDADLSGLLLKLSEFLYLLFISIQFVFYKHYDKDLNSAIKKQFGFKKNVQTGLFSFFNLVNLITLQNNKNENFENVKKW